MRPVQRSYETAAQRWSGLGPYYAMFPSAFADHVVKRYTKKGDTVLDPFAGRGTSIFSAAALERFGFGIELNPVGWVYGRAKLRPAPKSDVIARLEELGKNASRHRSGARKLPWFYRRCFCLAVRAFLLGARAKLNWQRDSADWTLMALLLVSLHGKWGTALSNQMRQTKAMSPGYAVRWWDKHAFFAPDVDPVEFMRKRIDWRYAKGRPDVTDSQVYLGNCLRVLPRLQGILPVKKVKLLFTSPPYYNVTNYHYDQWLRLWLLGGPAAPSVNGDKHKGRFGNQKEYKNLLHSTFDKARTYLRSDSVIYVRTDSRKYCGDTTLEVLKRVFPKKRAIRVRRPCENPTQTVLFGGDFRKDGEVDIVLHPK